MFHEAFIFLFDNETYNTPIYIYLVTVVYLLSQDFSSIEVQLNKHSNLRYPAQTVLA